jgi:hypothetical protein
MSAFRMPSCRRPEADQCDDVRGADVLQLHCAGPFFPLVATAAHVKNVLEYHSEQADLSAE